MAERGSLRPNDVVPLSARPAVLLPPDRRDMPEAAARECSTGLVAGTGTSPVFGCGIWGYHSEDFFKDIVI